MLTKGDIVDLHHRLSGPDFSRPKRTFDDTQEDVIVNCNQTQSTMDPAVHLAVSL